MFELIDIAGAYKSEYEYMIIEKYFDLEKNENIYNLYINNGYDGSLDISEDSSSEDESEENNDIIEYKWYENNSNDINRLLIFLKTEGGSYYDETNEILYGPNITNISRNLSYKITNFDNGYRNKHHDITFDDIKTTDKDLSLILNEIYGTIRF